MVNLTSDVSIPTAVVAALADVEVGQHGRWATVGERRCENDDPRTMRALLSEAIYSAWHAGRATEPSSLVPRRIRDLEFERLLREALPHPVIQAAGVVLSEPELGHDGSSRVLMEWDGVRVWVPPERIETALFAAGAKATITTASSRPALSPGFFFATGSRAGATSSDMVRMYFHIVDSAAAVAIWSMVLHTLERELGDYRAKLLSSPAMYPRRDALVVYLNSDHKAVTTDLARSVRGLAGLGAETSVFAEAIGPGLALAWEPRDPRPAMGGLSFGQHRANAIAEALLNFAQGVGDLGTLIADECRAGGIDMANFARNQILSESEGASATASSRDFVR